MAGSRDRVTIDLRGIGDALRSAAAGRDLTVAALARQALVDAIGSLQANAPLAARDSSQGGVVKLTLRLREPDAEALVLNAARLGLSYGAYVARLANGTPLPLPAADREADRAALLLHCDRLAQWAVDLHSLTRLLRAGCLESALKDLASSNAMAADVHRYLDLASSLLAQSRTNAGGFP
jgi:hypothetical protein